MRILDIINEAKDSKALLQAIKDGEAPEIHDASSSSNSYAWGDLQRLNLASKNSSKAWGTVRDVSWKYSPKAPGPITLVTGRTKKKMNPGDETTPVEVDYE